MDRAFFDKVVPSPKELLGANDRISPSCKFLFFALVRLVVGDPHNAILVQRANKIYISPFTAKQEEDVRKIKGNLSKFHSETLEEVLQLWESSGLLDIKSKVVLPVKLANPLSIIEYHTWWNSRTYKVSKVVRVKLPSSTRILLLLELVVHLKHLKRLQL
ncbi:hypothetical protein M9H77_03583 [Catharanthus roseus]|uniref:Uncharacterized protein n=1 Tax=Catharanthus roseus TaxID=4058 RepID=A0ACC0CBQ6_CATRO|nr:hypothetical protein M9H77_03583 [Catharanthus roseus]